MQGRELIVGDHWKPGQNGTHLVMCGASGQKAPLHEPYDDNGPKPGLDGVWSGPPIPFNKRTLVIWLRRDCGACQLNKEFFAGLEGQKRMHVVRVEATKENLEKYRHVTVLPMYDIVTPRVSSTSPYGSNTHLVSIRNDQRQQLSDFFQI
jgi:hypothetical protein